MSHPKLFSKLRFNLAYQCDQLHLSKQNNYAQLSSIKKYCKIYTNVVSGKCPFLKCTSCISELQH